MDLHAVSLSLAALAAAPHADAEAMARARAGARADLSAEVEVLNCDRFAAEKSLGFFKVPILDLVIDVAIGRASSTMAI